MVGALGRVTEKVVPWLGPWVRGPDAEVAAVFVDELLADPEAEAGADGALGGEERVKHLFGGSRSNAVAAVGDREADAWSAGRGVEGGAGADDDAAVVAYGVEGVGEEVGEDLAEFAGDAEDLERVVALLVDGGAGGLDFGFEKVDDGGYEVAGGVAGGGGRTRGKSPGSGG